MKIPSIKVPYRADDVDEDELRKDLLLKNQGEKQQDDFRREMFLRRKIDPLSIPTIMDEMEDNDGLGDKHSKYLKELKRREDQRNLEDKILKNKNREIVRDLVQYPDFNTYDFEKGSFSTDNIDLVPEGPFDEQIFENRKEVSRPKFNRLRSSLKKLKRSYYNPETDDYEYE